MKSFLLLLFATLYGACPAFAASSQYFLKTRSDFYRNKGQKEYIIDHIVDMTPAPFKIIDKRSGAEIPISQENSPVNVTKAYNDWFKNLNDFIVKQGRQEEFSFFQDIIDFGMSDKVVYPEYENDIDKANGLTVYLALESDPYWKTIKTLAGGLFLRDYDKIFIYINMESEKGLQNVLAHEVGHSLGISDAYMGGPLLKEIEYGSDLKPSLMGKELTFTCDDADALMNVIYKTLRYKNKLPQYFIKEADQPLKALKDNKKTQEKFKAKLINYFEFKSFCRTENQEPVILRDTKQINRKPIISYVKGHYYIVEFCKNGDIKSTLEIEATEPKNMFKKEVKKVCESIPYQAEKPDISLEQNLTFKFVDLYSGAEEKIHAAKNTVIYEHVANIIREIRFKDGTAKTTVRVKDKDGGLLYIYALLDDGYAFLYSLAERVAMLYDSLNPSSFVGMKFYYSSQPIEEIGINNPAMRQELRKIYNLFRYDGEKPYGVFETGAAPEQILQQGIRWQEYLNEYYPHNDVAVNCEDLKITDKDIVDFGKNIKGLTRI